MATPNKQQLIEDAKLGVEDATNSLTLAKQNEATAAKNLASTALQEAEIKNAIKSKENFIADVTATGGIVNPATTSDLESLKSQLPVVSSQRAEAAFSLKQTTTQTAAAQATLENASTQLAVADVQVNQAQPFSPNQDYTATNPAPPPATATLAAADVPPVTVATTTAPGNVTPPIPFTLPVADAALNKAVTDKAIADYAAATPAEKLQIEQITGLSSAQLSPPNGIGDNPAPVQGSIAADTTDPLLNPLKAAPAQDPVSGLTTANAEQLGAAYGYTAPEPVQGSIATDTTDPLGIGSKPAPVSPSEDGYGGASQAEADAINQATRENKISDAQDAEDAAAGAAIAGAQRAKQQEAIANQQKNANNADWRVRISLAPNAQYLYKDTSNTLLAPLALTSGVVFPYTPKIDTAYHASYQNYDLTHSNYRGYFYKNSYVDAVNLSCTFTAQNTSEANYLLAVIHFFKSVTKMFYGQDQENRGSPPPMVFITGLGAYQFSKHPCVVTEFRYNLPSDVDYIRADSRNMAGSTSNLSGLAALTNNPFVSSLIPPSIKRLGSSPLVNLVTGGAAGQLLGVTGVPKGAIQDTPSPPTIALNSPTYVPTKMDITLSLLPMQSRNQVSTQFNFKEFANGKLLKGGFW